MHLFIYAFFVGVGVGEGEWGDTCRFALYSCPLETRNISSDTMLEIQVLKIKAWLKSQFKLFRTKNWKSLTVEKISAPT